MLRSEAVPQRKESAAQGRTAASPELPTSIDNQVERGSGVVRLRQPMHLFTTFLATISVALAPQPAVAVSATPVSATSSTCFVSPAAHHKYAKKVYARAKISPKAHHRLAMMRYCAGSKKALHKMHRTERQLAQERRVRLSMRCGSTTCNRRLVYYLVSKHGGSSEGRCAVVLLGRESGFNHRIYNAAGSGAYGLPQALPGSKMANHGADWRTNPETQIEWYIDYVDGRYGGSCGALAFWNAHQWY